MLLFTSKGLDNGLLSANGLDAGADCPASAMTSVLSGVARIVLECLLFVVEQLVATCQPEALQSSRLLNLFGLENGQGPLPKLRRRVFPPDLVLTYPKQSSEGLIKSELSRQTQPFWLSQSRSLDFGYGCGFVNGRVRTKDIGNG